MDSNHITVLDTEIMPHNAVDTNTAVIEIVVRQHNQNGVLAHLTLDQNCVAPEKLQSIHSVVGESNNGVIIVDGIGHTVGAGTLSVSFVLSKVYPIMGIRFRISHLHQRVGLLLLFKDCCRRVQLLWLKVSIYRHSFSCVA